MSPEVLPLWVPEDTALEDYISGINERPYGEQSRKGFLLNLKAFGYSMWVAASLLLILFLNFYLGAFK